MIDAERLLRLRGLAKRTISRKARMLHHVYSWARIVDESTYVLRNYENIDRETIVPIRGQAATGHDSECQNSGQGLGGSRTGPNPRLDDFLRLEQNFQEDDRELEGPKDRESGLHDIHLEDTREFSETLYTQLYGISETWLSLVSRTTRLANIMDALSVAKQREDFAYPESLERRKQRLENMICLFAATDRQGGQRPHSSLPAVDVVHPREHMVRAMDSALVIFFYRRIRNVNPWILQEHVNNVMHALKDFEASCQTSHVEGPGSPWPAFMAGCEALSEEQRGYFSGWFDRASFTTGFSRLGRAKACMMDVWNRHDQHLQRNAGRVSDQVSTWVQVCKEENVHVLLS